MSIKPSKMRRVLSLILAITFISATVMAVTAFASDSSNVTVTLVDGDVSKQISTTAKTVGDFLEEQNITLEGNDTVVPSEETEISSGIDVVLKRNRTVVVICDGKESVLNSENIITKDVLIANGYSMSEDDYISKYAKDGKFYVEVIRVHYETVTSQVEVKSTEIIVYNNDMYQGESNIKKEGRDGLCEITNKIRYENGKEVSKVQLSEKMIKTAVDSVKEVGTKAPDPQKKVISSGVIDETNNIIYTSSGEELHYSNIIDVTATAYSPASCGKAPSHPAYGITATGLRATYGIIAVDPKVIPLGSKVYITAPDGSWTYGYAIAADTGGAIKGRKIDLCYDTNAECFQFGRRQARVYILN